ncbi:hypothetical protein FQN57_004530 [Myotisia sp. PD_48]|nr:hypothetical protein FQN57_004530 [Myotisia sp. PD_48]
MGKFLSFRSDDALPNTLNLIRILQILGLIPMIGMVADFFSKFISSGDKPPLILTVAVVVAPIAGLHCVIAILMTTVQKPLYTLWGGLDFLILIALFVVAVVIGTPLSIVNCDSLPRSTGIAGDIVREAAKLKGGKTEEAGTLASLIISGKSACIQMKAVWGISVGVW